jgi:hypothetical protein
MQKGEIGFDYRRIPLALTYGPIRIGNSAIVLLIPFIVACN